MCSPLFMCTTTALRTPILAPRLGLRRAMIKFLGPCKPRARTHKQSEGWHARRPNVSASEVGEIIVKCETNISLRRSLRILVKESKSKRKGGGGGGGGGGRRKDEEEEKEKEEGVEEERKENKKKKKQKKTRRRKKKI